MTEFEMLSMTQAYHGNGMTAVMNFFSILTAYLVAGYLAGQRLSFSMSLFATAAFVVSSLNTIFLMYILGRQYQALLTEMHAFAQAGKGLAWSPIASGPAPNVWVAGVAALAVMFSGLVGGVYFFYQCRRVNLKAELGLAPKA